MDEREQSRVEEPEDQGIPDLAGPPPKGPAAQTEEDVMLPGDRPTEQGTTAAEQREGESLDDRLSEEEPDGPEALPRRVGRLIDEGDGLHDPEKDEVAAEAAEDSAGLSPEEAALRRDAEPVGLTGGPDTYVEDDGTEEAGEV